MVLLTGCHLVASFEESDGSRSTLDGAPRVDAPAGRNDGRGLDASIDAAKINCTVDDTELSIPDDRLGRITFDNTSGLAYVGSVKNDTPAIIVIDACKPKLAVLQRLSFPRPLSSIAAFDTVVVRASTSRHVCVLGGGRNATKQRMFVRCFTLESSGLIDPNKTFEIGFQVPADDVSAIAVGNHIVAFVGTQTGAVTISIDVSARTYTQHAPSQLEGISSVGGIAKSANRIFAGRARKVDGDIGYEQYDPQCLEMKNPSCTSLPDYDVTLFGESLFVTAFAANDSRAVWFGNDNSLKISAVTRDLAGAGVSKVIDVGVGRGIVHDAIIVGKKVFAVGQTYDKGAPVVLVADVGLDSESLDDADWGGRAGAFFGVTAIADKALLVSGTFSKNNEGTVRRCSLAGCQP